MSYKKYVNISNFNINYANRGNSALCYGAISFLLSRDLLHNDQELITFHYYRNFLKKNNHRKIVETYNISGGIWKHHIIPIFFAEKWLLVKFGILLKFTRLSKFIREIEYVSADFGGDGFSDIYGDKLYMARFNQALPLIKAKIPLIILPQTIGPFKKVENLNFAKKILEYAKRTYVRDDKFEDNLKSFGIKYERTKDLSAYMQPEPWNIEIKPNPIGINVSGLAYSNGFRSLAGQFTYYPKLIDELIKHFRDKGHTIYLIPHSYRYGNPEPFNDDMIACSEVYNHLENKDNVVFVDKNLTSPQLKYLISKMKFFIGTRMHANFAAIYTGVPLFGLAYSYKFEGAFNANGLDGKAQTAMINNIKKWDIDGIINKIDAIYNISRHNN